MSMQKINEISEYTQTELTDRYKVSDRQIDTWMCRKTDKWMDIDSEQSIEDRGIAKDC